MFDEVVIARPCAFRCIDRRVVQSQTTLEIEGRDLMRSTKIKLGVVCAAGCLAALTSAMWVSGAGAAGVVGSGTASATKSVCGAGTGTKATGRAVKGAFKGGGSGTRSGAKAGGRHHGGGKSHGGRHHHHRR